MIVVLATSLRFLLCRQLDGGDLSAEDQDDQTEERDGEFHRCSQGRWLGLWVDVSTSGELESR